ncbi:rRNA bioproteinsis protein rrp36 [Saitozyma podzolica]|uniref:rRNA biogenesis protein RRP36 n=1 Tax=Saitozyma podzolica TaxID=1890683 RepID=A0A427YQD6_9TREE|nr:rRNA bioproteinsis protein rrp36 [Saitozyma podzolica]
MARRSAVPSRADARSAPARKYASPDDGVLDEDSEVDEFALGREDEPSDEELEEEEEQEGMVQWEPDDWEGEEDEMESDDEDDMTRLREGLTSLPLAAVMKAQRSLRKSPSDSGSENEAGPSMPKEQRLAEMKMKLAQMQQRKGKGKASVSIHESEEAAAPSADLKRQSKHAPVAMSTKRQVSRLRQVVDVQKQDRRDPRFSSVSGQVNVDLHAKAYDFLPGMLSAEFDALKTAVAMAVKAERTCAWADKPARTAERERLEAELGKQRTRLERTRREARDREVLAKVKKEEREKQKQGKGAWHMKQSEKRDLLLKSRFESLEEEGAKRR